MKKNLLIGVTEPDRTHSADEAFYTKLVARTMQILSGCSYKLEFKTDFGFVDLCLTGKGGEKTLIETKNVKSWKQALGQIICYRDCTKNSFGRLLLICDSVDQIKQQIYQIPLKYDIITDFIIDHDLYFYDEDFMLQKMKLFTNEDCLTFMEYGTRSHFIDRAVISEQNNGVDIPF